jgi:hypothetical protein
MARFTVNKDDIGRQPTKEFKAKMCLNEHSPIREVRFLIQMYGIKTWVAQHLARHDFGGEHHTIDCAAVQYGATQRTDRTNVDRDNLTQGALTNHSMTLNAQDLINISRKRLCSLSSMETVRVWKEVVSSIFELEPELAGVCVPECVYRGFCPNETSCGYNKTKSFSTELKRYRNEI